MPKKKNSGLGRGLDAIFLENSLENLSKSSDNNVTKLQISLVDPKADQPRKHFDKAALEQLANSIKENGLLQPILVREYGNGRYQIIAGERRFRASKIAELSEIPAIILDKDDLKVAEISLIENIQREDLNPIEEAMAFRALREQYNLTQEEVADKVGRSRSAITNMLRLLDLPSEVLELLRSGELKEGHARALLGLEEEAHMILLANRTVASNLSVREVEAAVKRMNALAEKADEEVTDPASVQVRLHMKELEKRAMSALGRKVRISRSTHKKVGELTYDCDEDLEALLRHLCGENIFDETEQ